MQLPFAMLPLLHFTSSRRRMGRFANGWFLLAAGWTSCVLITVLDIYGLPECVAESLARGRGWNVPTAFGVRSSVCRLITLFSTVYV